MSEGLYSKFLKNLVLLDPKQNRHCCWNTRKKIFSFEKFFRKIVLTETDVTKETTHFWRNNFKKVTCQPTTHRLNEDNLLQLSSLRLPPKIWIGKKSNKNTRTSTVMEENVCHIDADVRKIKTSGAQLVSLFNGISIFLGCLIPRLS